MAMFPTHIKTSTLLGVGYGAVAYVGYGVPLSTSLVGAGLCSVAGMLPDIDSGPGIPLREITTFLASVVPTMLITRLLSYNLTQQSLILAGALIYVAIRYGLSHFLRNYTIHRGMFHSFPAMAIFGLLTYLLFYGENTFTRLFMVAAVCLGFFSHLLLDEIYSVEWNGRPHLKNSFGSAMKFVGNGWWPNFTCYGKLIFLAVLVMNDSSMVHRLHAGQGSEVASSLGQAVKEKWNAVATRIRARTSADAPAASIPAAATSRTASGDPSPRISSTVPPPAFVPPSSPSTALPQATPYAAPSTAAPPAQPAQSWSIPGKSSAQPATGSQSPSRTSGARFWQ